MEQQIIINTSTVYPSTVLYMGIDCSSKAIHSVWVDQNERLITQCKWNSKKKNFEERFIEFGVDFWTSLSKIKVILNEIAPVQAAVEAAIYIQNPKATIAIASVAGLARFACHVNGIECEFVDNTKWKRDIIGKGNASKIEIKNFAIDKWGDIFQEQDFADAACIALWKKRRNN
jgi:Holliday junction resolvasome RuvABC endonuclease subunit|tara:strand:- start:41 stop:562 length:522 start_codon:yes stop_codon:yes gene_type:complete